MITGIINNRGGATAIGVVAIVLFIVLNFGASSLTGAQGHHTNGKGSFSNAWLSRESSIARVYVMPVPRQRCNRCVTKARTAMGCV